MYDVIARPKENIIYALEKPRLAAYILGQLAILKRNPTSTKLLDFEQNINTLLVHAIRRVTDSAYLEAAKAVQHPVDATIGLSLRRQAFVRAKQASSWIADTTGTALDIKAAMSKSKALSLGRADSIAVNELSLAFFGGTRYGWGLDKKARKSWLLSSMHDLDDTCDDNADEGPISINAAFQSGDFIPPAHIKCECELGLSRIR
jgi:hypothetical protein